MEDIKTVRQRNITVKLSDTDCERLVRKCGEHGLTVDELLENFVSDLIGGQGTNGSDERDLANQWFNRCWFGAYPEDTFLQYLLINGYNPGHYLDVLDNIKDAEGTKQRAADHPEDYDPEELSYLDDDIADWQEELADMRADWKPDKEPDMQEEVDIIKKWVKEKEKLMSKESDIIQL